MKNLKKVLALVVALTMVLGTVGFAAYTDVAEDAGEYTAVSTLSSLGILTGYEDGSFKPDGDITRAEFAAVVCRALGAKVSGSAVTGFTDVPADHWASAYIAYCAGAGIVNGMGDGTFAPSANVTVEQAVKMLVVALGYEPMAAAKGGYPTGYMVVANTNGITEGVGAQTAAATRADVAKLVYNALDVPMMVQDGFGTQVSFKVADGREGNPAYQSLLTGLEVAKLEGVVNGTAIIPVSGGSTTEAGYVSFAVEDAYDSEDFEDNNGDPIVGPHTFKVGEGVNADAYFGYSSIVYVREYSKNKWEIIAIMPGEESTVLELGLEDIDDIDTTKVEYYTDANQYDTKKVTLDSPVFYWNYTTGTELLSDVKAALTTDIYTDDGGNTFYDVEFEFIDNDADNKYEFVIAKAYTYDRVKKVEVENDLIDGYKYDFTFDFEDETKVISIVDKNGDAIELADFAEDDVIAYIAKDNDTYDSDWIEIINLGQNAVTGTIGETNDEAVYVDGTEYVKATGDKIELGDEGTFYLTRTGKIFGFEKSASAASNYGYILATDITNNGGWEDAWQIKMLTKDNEIVTYTVRDGFEVVEADGTTATGNANIKQNDPSAELLSDIRIDSAANGANSAGTQFQQSVGNRIVTYKLDSKGLIREICKVNATEKTDKLYEYNADADKLFTSIETDAVIFNISGAKETSAFVTTTSALVDENEYKGWYVTNDGEVDCLILTYAGASVDFTQDLAVIASVTTTKVDEEDAYRVRYYVSGEKETKEIIIMADETVSVPFKTTIGENVGEFEIEPGALMMFTDDGNGVASAYTIVANATFNADSAADSSCKPYDINNDVITFLAGDGEKLDTQIVYGYIDDKRDGSKGDILATIDGNEDPELVILDSTNKYTINDASSSKPKFEIGRWNAFDVRTKAVLDQKDPSNKKAFFFIAKVVDSKLADIVTFSTPYAVE